MKSLSRKPALELWNQWWLEMDNEWFKVEVLQDYTGEDEGPSLSAWLAGDKKKSIDLMPAHMKGWIEMCQKSPAHKRRFHIVDTPYTPYLEWEIELDKQINVPLCGEEIFLIPREEVTHLSIPDGDVMIFDQKRVARNHYNQQGLVEQIDFYQAGEDNIATFLNLSEVLPEYGTKL